MIPDLAMFYGGLVRTKNILSTMMHSFVAMAVIGVHRVVCGYSIAFGFNILLVEKTVGFRIAPESELAGLDRSIHGEQGYGYTQEY